MVKGLPIAGVRVGRDVIVPAQISGFDELNAASPAGQDLVTVHHVNACVASTSKIVGVPELANAVAMLAVPRNREPTGRIKVALLLVEYLIEDFVYSSKG